MLFDQVEFKRKFSLNLYRNLRLSLGEMSFTKDFAHDNRGDLYPVLERSENCRETVAENRYQVQGRIRRRLAQFFPYGVYEMTVEALEGACGFAFRLPEGEASVMLGEDGVEFSCGDVRQTVTAVPEFPCTLAVACRPGCFDTYFVTPAGWKLLKTFETEVFRDSNCYASFSDGSAIVAAEGRAVLDSVSAYLDCGISQADMRPIRYENGDIMVENGRIYLTMSVRMEALKYQGVFSWIPGTAEFRLTGALFFDAGDGRWCGDVGASILYHRGRRQWLLWVVSFSHGHTLAHSDYFDGDPRFGVNPVDVHVMPLAPEGTPRTAFRGFEGDEDPDLFYDEQRGKWCMSVCRLDPQYHYVFFESDDPFEGYTCIGQSGCGAETGGSFVRIRGQRYFVCGNHPDVSPGAYRIYSREGMVPARFDYPDGGFRGWGTLMPIPQATRTRYYWLTFDRHLGSSFNWSYGNLYCFEAVL